MERFDSLLHSIGIPGERVLLATVPLPERYELPEVVGDLALKQAIRVYREAALEQWPPEAFPDGYHLGEPQAGGFTKGLIQRVPLISAER